MQQGKVICFAFGDGTVQYRDRVTMGEVYNEPNFDTIMSPHQVGFQFTNETPCECLPGVCAQAALLSANHPVSSPGGIFAHKLLLRPDLRRCICKMEQDALPHGKCRVFATRKCVAMLLTTFWGPADKLQISIALY